MTKKIGLITLTIILVIGLCACGGNNPDDVAIFTGEWKLISIAEGEDVTDITAYADDGITGKLTLKDDMTLTFFLIDDESIGTWKANSAEEISLSIDEAGSAKGTLVDGKLTIEEGKAKFVFTK